MSLINKEKVLNGVGKAVDATNKAADKASSFVKEKEIDKKAVKVAKTAEKGIKKAGNKLGEVAGEIVAGSRVRLEELHLRLQEHLRKVEQHQILS